MPLPWLLLLLSLVQAPHRVSAMGAVDLQLGLGLEDISPFAAQKNACMHEMESDPDPEPGTHHSALPPIATTASLPTDPTGTSAGGSALARAATGVLPPQAATAAACAAAARKPSRQLGSAGSSLGSWLSRLFQGGSTAETMTITEEEIDRIVAAVSAEACWPWGWAA